MNGNGNGNNNNLMQPMFKHAYGKSTKHAEYQLAQTVTPYVVGKPGAWGGGKGDDFLYFIEKFHGKLQEKNLADFVDIGVNRPLDIVQTEAQYVDQKVNELTN